MGLGVGAMSIGFWGCFVFGPDLGPADVQLIVPFGWESVWPIALSLGIARHS